MLTVWQAAKLNVTEPPQMKAFDLLISICMQSRLSSGGIYVSVSEHHFDVIFYMHATQISWVTPDFDVMCTNSSYCTSQPC